MSRGWPHEAAVNVTGEGARTSARTSGPALHITFGIESSTYGSYEALLHHALEVAQVEHPNFHHVRIPDPLCPILCGSQFPMFSS